MTDDDFGRVLGELEFTRALTIQMTAVVVGTPGRLTYLFRFVNTPEEISLGVRPAVFAVGGLIGLVYALVQTYRRSKAPPTDPT